MTQTTTPPKPRWYDKDLRRDIVVPTMRFAGGPKRAGAMAGLLGAVPFYLWARKNKLEWPALRAFAGILPLVGGLTYYGTKPRVKNYTTDEWINSMGVKTDDVPDNHWFRLSGKTSADSIRRTDLFDLIADIPGLGNSQRNFLAMGAVSAPGDNNITISELSQGFGAVTHAATGGLVSKVTAGIEGAVIGNAFSRLIGLSPTSRKWVTGMTAAADALWGNRLVRAIGNLYD